MKLCINYLEYVKYSYKKAKKLKFVLLFFKLWYYNKKITNKADKL